MKNRITNRSSQSPMALAQLLVIIMKYKWTLSIKQILLVLGYSSIFPLTNLLGEKTLGVGILLTFPFLQLAWLGGMCFVWIIGTDKAYLLGASITILMQAWLVMIIWQNTWPKKRSDQVQSKRDKA
jgi:hypothetical protein